MSGQEIEQWNAYGDAGNDDPANPKADTFVMTDDTFVGTVDGAWALTG